jgi:O-acetyl-ADP-ribose deacetylase
MPAISSGIFGFPKDRCAKILVQEAKKFLVNNTTSLRIVEFCILMMKPLTTSKKNLQGLHRVTE